MSTFNGVVAEFPDIRIDFFRRNATQRPPLACFLSHVHSDHLAGLESLRSPFVYCSPATREILLRLEKYPCRINYAKGILEAKKQTYQHLSKILKAMPLQTPTILELEPGHEIQVTLFDANHCTGAVMFLIEKDSTAVLYTGDMRCEPWFVNSIARHAAMIEYTAGIKTLDTIYLDTSFTDDVPFQSKSEGISELIRKVKQYPKDTVFYFQAWTYGYEEVWLALSKALQSRIHVDDYKMRIYQSLAPKASDTRSGADIHLAPEAAALVGFTCGNTRHPGCLTADENVRIHCCEKGDLCKVTRLPNVVTIQPIVAHLSDGTDIAEVGVGGGADDLERDAELGFLSPDGIKALTDMIQSLANHFGETSNAAIASILKTMSTGRNLHLDLAMSKFNDDFSASIPSALEGFAKPPTQSPAVAEAPDQRSLPKTIRFPYARHSSYAELCHFVETFKPNDVWPCTENPQEWHRHGISIESLFGRYCTKKEFAYDKMLASVIPPQDEDARDNTQTTGPESVSEQHPSPFITVFQPGQSAGFEQVADENQPTTAQDRPRKRSFEQLGEENEESQEEDSQRTTTSITSHIRETHSASRHESYNKVMENLYDGEWDIAPLLSIDDHHSVPEKEL